ncbi:MAG: enoyl-CoA hydratase/isomerase [Hyphomonadaceae bacterium]|nr:enoyl-CoA hydratase/isomerase [Hyphomonadaceae bacterium]
MAKVKYELEGPLALVTLSDPTTLNAAGVDMTEELIAALERATREARGIVLTGEGRGFSSGANLSSGSPTMDADGKPDLGAALEKTYNPAVTLMRNLPIPLVTAVNGVAAGVGCSFALMGDLIVAGESAYFLQAFRRIGLVPDGSATYQLPRMIGRARAMELMLLGEKLPAAKALEWGLINRCVPDDQVLATARTLALELANGPASIGMIRKLAWQSLDASWDEQLRAERNMQRQAGQTDDFREGVQAFFQKRPAKFKGA